MRPCLIAAALAPDEANADREHGGGSEAACYCLCFLLIPCYVHRLTSVRKLVCTGLLCSAALARLTARPQLLKVSLLYGLLSRGEEKLIPNWLMQEQTLAQAHVDQLTGLVWKYQVGWLTM